MTEFTIEELQFIKDHLNYPQDSQKADMYYALVTKLRELLNADKST